MRVALAAVLFSAPDLLLLDEPTNYLDLEGTLWLIDYLAAYPATLIVISHDRDLLDAVCDHILHLDRAKLSLYRGNYTRFERQRREAQAIQLKHKKKQEEQRRASAGFRRPFPRQGDEGAPGAVAPQDAGQDGARSRPSSTRRSCPSACPRRQKIVAADRRHGGRQRRLWRHAGALALSISPISDDDRIGLLGANGNGKSTFAKLVAGRLPALRAASVERSAKLDVGFFAQHQIDDLDRGGTPYQPCRGTDAAARPRRRIRARAAQIGFPERQGRYARSRLCRAARRPGC